MSVGLLMRASSGVAVVVLALGGGAARPLADARAATDPLIAAVGDIACDPTSPSFNNGNGTGTECRQRYTSDLVVGAGLAAVLVLGDIQYEDATLLKFSQSYGPTWGRVKNITRPVPGNHEYHTAGAAGYFDYFGPLAGERGKGYYSFDVGAWHLIALNSECGQVGGCGSGSPQHTWLLQDLAAHSSAACTLAYWHNPRFSSGSEHGDDATYGPFWDALYAHDADLVLVGHDHNYERFAPQSPARAADAARGIRQFVVGTGGRSLRPIGTLKANSEVFRSDTFGVLELTLRPTGYEWRFVPEAGKTFTDTGSASCHSPPAAPTPPPARPPAPTADFTAAPTTGAAPLTVSFTDTSTGPPTSWAWDLDGNGAADSTLRNPTFTYTVPGRYAVTLTASNASGSNVAVKPAYVVVSGTSTRTSRRTFAPGADGSVAGGGAVAPRRVLRVGGRAGYRSYVRFGAPRVRGSPTRAALRLYVTDASSSRVTIRRCSTGWTESGIARGNAPRLVGRPLARAVPGRSDRWLELSLSIRALPLGRPICLAIGAAGADGASFSSREGRRPPQLVVTATTPA